MHVQDGQGGWPKSREQLPQVLSCTHSQAACIEKDLYAYASKGSEQQPWSINILLIYKFIFADMITSLQGWREEMKQIKMEDDGQPAAHDNKEWCKQSPQLRRI